MTDNLYDDVPKHWSGQDVGLTGMIRIDGKVYRYEHVQYLLLCVYVLCSCSIFIFLQVHVIRI